MKILFILLILYQPFSSTVYTPTGDSINPPRTPTPLWEPAYTYYYWDGVWYRNKDGDFDQWNTPLGWGIVSWRWRNYYGTVSPEYQVFRENPLPLDGIWVFLLLAILKFIYNTNYGYTKI